MSMKIGITPDTNNQTPDEEAVAVTIKNSFSLASPRIHNFTTPTTAHLESKVKKRGGGGLCCSSKSDHPKVERHFFFNDCMRN